jgi:hypothetical protein
VRKVKVEAETGLRDLSGGGGEKETLERSEAYVF